MSVTGAPPQEGFSGMKLPSLIKQLKVVLDQYPDDGQILKELIQNAEDAGAKVMKILYNGKQTEVTETDDFPKTPHLKTLKGPGLCVFNDAQFEDQDWEGIRMIQSSVKEQRHDKVGKFGLGFKSVFHLTDVPLIISGEHVLFIDPHVFDEDPNKVCFMSRLDNVGDFEAALLQVLDGTFGFCEETLRRGHFDGTLFWFPLRSQKTMLSENIYDAGKIEDLLKAFKEEAPHMMLFLRSLTRIQVYEKSANLFGKDIQGDEMTHLMSVTISSGSQQDNLAIRAEFSSVIRKHKGGLPKVPDERRYYLQVTVDDHMLSNTPAEVQTTWLVLQYYSSDKVSKSFKRLCSDPSIASSPCVGLAVNLDQDEAGHIFCFLPLPLEEKSPTGLPVHVHGHFALSQNRRHLKWPTADQKKNQAQTDKAIRWNQCLLQEAFPHAYASLLEEMISHQHSNNDAEFVQRIYRTMPIVSEVTDQWQGLCSTFYKELIGRTCLYTPHNDRWISINEAVFLQKECCKEMKDTIMQLFTACQMDIVDIPAHLQEALVTFFKQHGDQQSDLTFVNEKSVCDLFRSNTSNIEPTQKRLLLQYICSNGPPEYLHGTELLPLANGSFEAFGKTDSVLLCPLVDIDMFPGLEHQFVLFDETTEHLFLKMCDKGMFNLKRLTRNTFCQMLMKSLDSNPDVNRLDPASKFNKSWLRSVWNYITEHDIDVDQEFPDAPLIPVDTENSEASRLCSASTSMICANVETVGRIDEHLSKALRHLGVVTLPYVPEILKKNSSVLGNIIKYPSMDGLLKVLGEVSKKPTMLENVREFNINASFEEKSSLLGRLKECQSLPESTMQLLQRLDLFSSTENNAQDLSKCIHELSISEPNVKLHVTYPAEYLRCGDGTSARLMNLLGAQQATVSDVILDILRKMKEGNRRYSKEDIEGFMFDLIEGKENYLNESKIRKSATDVKFMRTMNSNDAFKAMSLFFPEKDVCKLFVGQDVFPTENFLKPSLKDGLKLLGLRTAKDVTAEDLCKVGSHVDELMKQDQTDQAIEKGQALLAFLKENIRRLDIKLLKDLRYISFVPCKVDKSRDYPQALKLHAQECSKMLARLDEVWSSNFLYVIGSVSLIAKDISENVLKAFNVTIKPPLDKVLDHLEMTIQSYKETDDVEDKYSRVMKEICSFLSEIKLSSWSQANKERLSNIPFIFSPERGFQLGRNMWIKKSKSDLDVKPYRFCLPKVLHLLEPMVLFAGGQQNQSPRMLVDVLLEIKEKHDNAKRKNIDLSGEIEEDLRIILPIVTTLKDLGNQRPDGIVLPIHQDGSALFLRMKPITECTYCNADWLKDQTVDNTEEEDDETLFFLHKNISEDTAKELGITYLTDRVMAGTEKINLNYSQGEPLTTRLHNILKGYNTSSIPKEMIQNAEDAKAKKVMFLYDERKNPDARTSLMNESMASVQGPALWVYNDAKFSDLDFTNIQKLGGATKENDQTKIGRFGLGFNSVYNLTDVPSFISGKNVVIFDPHQSYLGKPGIKADLTSVKNRRMLQTMKGQFKPFDGIFGCHIDADGNEEICDGTLFRFPLRTEEQAEDSLISDLYYTPSKMKEFLQRISKTAGNLLMFTHHVNVVEIYHLKKDMSPPDYQCLLRVDKDLKSQHYISPSGTALVNPHLNPLTYLPSKPDAAENVVYAREKDDIYLRERAAITLTTTKAFEHFDIQQQNDRIDWHITWSFEKDSSFKLSDKTLTGLLPLAATAVCLKDVNDGSMIGRLSFCPPGFFSSGQLFSVFPLPLPPTSLNMHVSAQFAMSDDRQHLCEQEDDSKRGDWNKHLETFVITRTIISTLKGIGSTVNSDLESYFMLWPTVSPRCGQEHDHVSKPDIAKAFYRTITSEGHCVFPIGAGQFVDLKDATILDPALAFDSQVGQIAIPILKKFLQHGQVVELPRYILNEFKAAGVMKALKKQVMDRKKFFDEVFLPNMKEIPSHDCYELIKYGLSKSDPALDDLLKSRACIPSKPNGTLKRPEQLVHPEGMISKLFMDEDCCFPHEFFETKETLERLVSLGMRTDELSWENLIERISTMTGLFEKENDMAQKRCLYILQYLNDFDHTQQCRRFTRCPDSIRDEMRDKAFLPVLHKPTEWPYRWASESQHKMSRPKELFFDNAVNIVGSLHSVLDSNCLQGLVGEREVLKWLGVREKDSVTMEDAVNQLLHISNEIPSGKTVSGTTAKVLQDIYKHLNFLCSSGTHFNNTLKNEQILLHKEVMIRPEQAAFHLGVDLEPFLYQIEHTQQNQFCHMLQAMGVEKRFSSSRVKKELESLSTRFQGKCLTPGEVRIYMIMVTLWLELLQESKDVEAPQMLLPNNENYLKDSSSLCLDDCDWVSGDSEMQFVHPTVSRDVALKLKVHTRMHANLKSIMKPLNAKSFGAREKLTSRLKGILEGYPKDSSIMKELLQNADDACATELMFIKDFREHPTERIFDDKWKPMQGPALCIWNNKGFTEKDIEGIQALGEGSKSEDPLKTGQYGVGFNAVYHITDAPSFLTVSTEIPESLCIFDPNLQYISWADQSSPGCQLEANENSKHNLRDIFGCYLREPFEATGEGTMFRLPLRTKEMAKISEISKEHVDEDGINKLLDDFKKDMKESLLFLHNVRKISIKTVTADGRLVEEFSVTAVINELDEKKLSKHKQIISNAAAKRKKPTNQGCEKYADWNEMKSTTEITVTTRDDKGSEQNWLVVHQFGFAKPSATPEIIKTCIEDGTIGNLPRGGVAVPQGSHCKGKVFCILPLRLNTGLPIHVNGHFALDNETRGNLWHGSHTYRTVWNESIIRQVIVPAYLKALGSQSTSLFQSELTMDEYKHVVSFYHGLFPMIDQGTDDYWKLLGSEFYEQVIHTESKLLPVVNPKDKKYLDLPGNKDATTSVTITLVSPTGEDHGVFDTISNSEHKSNLGLVEILKDLEMKVIDCPCSIHSEFVRADIDGLTLVTSPELVMQFLKTFSSSNNSKCQLQIPSLVKETPLKNKVSVNNLTLFCQSAGTEGFLAELPGLPLLLTQDSVLRCFDNNNPTIVTHWTELVFGSRERAVHRHIVDSYMKYTRLPLMPRSIQRLDIQTLSTLLPTMFPQLSSRIQVAWQQSDAHPSMEWIAKVWGFLSIELMDYKKQSSAKAIIESLQPLKHWCLLPVVIKHGQEESHFLYPISEAENVLILKNRLSKLSCLANLAAPLLNSEAFADRESLQIAEEIVVSEQSPLSMMKAIANAAKNDLVLDKQAANAIMSYICNHVECFQNDEALPVLKSLVIFENLSGQLTNCCFASVFGVKDHDSIPKDGIALWCSGSGIELLKCSESTECVFSMLSIKVLEPEKLYQSFVLPNFLKLPKDVRTTHILFIRDHLLHRRNPELTQSLRELHFIESQDGSMHRAEEYFSRYEPLFRIFKTEHFPPAPYDTDEWKSFLEIAGITKTVSKDHFLQFAKQLQSHCDEPITKETEQKSKALVKHLLRDRRDLLEDRFLNKVKSIRFVLPHQMEKQPEQREMIKQIHPQFQQGRLIAFSGSVSPQHCLYVWSSCTMFDSSADPQYTNFNYNSRNHAIISNQLGIINEPTMETVCTHIEILCTALQQKLAGKRREDSFTSLLKQVFEAIYKHVHDKIQQKPQIQQRLKNTAFIFLPEENLLVQPKQIVVELPEGKLVKGYMHKAPTHFGKYFDLFLLLGAAKTVTANHYAEILQTLKQKTRDAILDPNERMVVKNATKHLFECLAEEAKAQTLSIPTLYLLDRNCVLVDSTKLVVADNGILERRVGSLSLNFFVGFGKLEISVLNEEEVFDGLPTRYRPRILSHAVTETMVEDCRQNASSGRLSEEYKTIVRHRSFLEGVVRVISDQMKLNRQKGLDEESLAKIEKDIASLSIQEVKELKTVLTFDGKQVKSSEESCTCFLDTSCTPLRMYLNSTKKMYAFHKNVLHKGLAEAINKITGFYLTINLSLLEGMLAVPVGSIGEFLDKMMVTACSYVSGKKEDIVFPNPGTYVPKELHWMLDNSFSTFEEDEYVGLEIYDPLNEESERQADLTGPLYVYAKIVSVISEGDLPIHGRYRIDIGENEHREVSALDLYKFCRIERGVSNELVVYTGSQSSSDDSKESMPKTPEAKPLDFEKVLKEIRETLTEAWKTDDKKLRDKVKKRLLLKWHPDKNRENADFCTKVFQRLQNYINTLENGGKLKENSGTDDPGPNPRSSGFDQWFYEEMNRRSRQHQKDYESHRKRNFDFEDFFSHSWTGGTNYGGHRSAREEPQPQPDEARRWMRQARVDLRVARQTLSIEVTASNWACFQCYMACEKAAKALLYNRDGKVGNKHRSDDLDVLVYRIQQSSIQRLLLQLIQLVGSSSKMQNPAKLDYPTIPSEAYTATTALQACTLTEEVLQKTDEIIG